MRRKVYRDNKYNNKNMEVTKKFLKGIVVGVALGTVVICGRNMFMNNIVKADNYTNQKPTYVQTINNDISDNNDKEAITITDPFNVGSSPDKDMVIDFLSSKDGQYIYKYAEQYGVDPNIMASIAMQETACDHYGCIPGGDSYSGYGVGLMQLESPSGEEISAYNYNTNEWDTEYITMDAACDIETNIKIGCMMFQNKLKENQGNVLLSIQSHNYGQYMIDMMIDNLYGRNATKVKKEYNNISWLSEIKRIHNNPEIYLDNWSESKYGDGNYLEHVLRFCPSNIVKFKYAGFEYSFNIKAMKITDMFEYGTSIKK